MQLGRAKIDGSYTTGNNWSGQIDDVWVLRGAAGQDVINLLGGGQEIDL